MEKDLNIKYKRLLERLKEVNRPLVAFSGGVDSTLLARLVFQVHGKESEAITIDSVFLPRKELQNSLELASEIGIPHRVIKTEKVITERVMSNPPERCYHCKSIIFSLIKDYGKENNFHTIVDGSNLDDAKDYRPGEKALAELAILSPLRESGLTKKDIRLLSKELGLPTWDYPALACLASRIPYNHKITREKLKAVEEAESFLKDKGFTQLRVRHHETIARIELLKDEYHKLFENNLMEEINDRLKIMRFKYITLDMAGYRMGSLNCEIENLMEK